MFLLTGGGGAPAPPSAPTFSEVTPTSVSLTWDEPDNVAYYIVQYQQPEDGEVFRDIVYLNEWTVVGLEPDTNYEFEISSVNEVGQSPPSQRATVSTLGVPGKWT